MLLKKINVNLMVALREEYWTLFSTWCWYVSQVIEQWTALNTAWCEYWWTTTELYADPIPQTKCLVWHDIFFYSINVNASWHGRHQCRLQWLLWQLDKMCVRGQVRGLPSQLTSPWNNMETWYILRIQWGVAVTCKESHQTPFERRLRRLLIYTQFMTDTSFYWSKHVTFYKDNKNSSNIG